MNANPFLHQTVAARYARGRPYFHPLVVQKISEFLDFQQGHCPQVTLDVGCGTGQSAIALKQLATYVVGTDASVYMLREASKHTGIRYVHAFAESLPFPNEVFDLITASLAFHWFARDRFLSEASRLLRSRHWLVIYNHWFLGRVTEIADFGDWYGDVYLKRYPPASRDDAPLTSETAESHSFELVEQTGYVHEALVSYRELSSYLMTQSNIALAVELGTQSAESVHEWLTRSLNCWFADSKYTCQFAGYIWYLQRS